KEELVANAKKARERSLNLVKSGLDVFVAMGLLQLAPNTVDARVTGLLGFVTSVISCYQASEISRLASASSRIDKERRRSSNSGSLNSKQVL
ncbi:hypothetical protein CBR_g70808, partial [Chara braunii]